MKRLFRLLLILGLAAGTWSCADDGTPSVSINGGTDFLSLDHLARSGKITVNAPAPWSVTLAPENYGQDEKPDWLTLSAEEGPAGYSEIDVTFAENPGPARSASLLFSCDGKTLAFTVSQSAGGTGFDAPDYYFYISVGTIRACTCFRTTNRATSPTNAQAPSTPPNFPTGPSCTPSPTPRAMPPTRNYGP